MPNLKKPDARLISAVSYLQPHAVVADIGTDHAYLPIYLVQQGLVDRAVACDIGEGPLSRAKQNIEAAGLSQTIQTKLTDGLHDVENFCPDHILIFGMGGELIQKILSEAPWVKDPAIRLILQPMSRAEILRRYLWETGFATVGETLSKADGRIYQTICAVWQGIAQPFSAVDAIVGKPEHHTASPLYSKLIDQQIQTQIKILHGKQRSAQKDSSENAELLQALLVRRQEIGGAK